MKKGKKKILKIFLGLSLIIILSIPAFLLVLTIYNKQIPLYEAVEIKKAAGTNKQLNNDLSILSWNIGYGGLGKEMDFFYEGGNRVRPEKEEFMNYLSGIRQFIRSHDTDDFILLQEADLCSKRSYHENEVTAISGALDHHCYAVGKNYESLFVPFPVSEPMGPVESGIVTFSRYHPLKAERIGFGTKFPWPKQLFFLQRCFLVLRFEVGQGRELVLINTHNSAFDNTGELRKAELRKLRTYMTEEYRKGNWVIAGGDWNNNPAGFRPEKISTGDLVKTVEPPISSTYFPGWTFAYDPRSPTNRDVDEPYQKGKTKTTVIDFFVLSPNVEINSVKTIETGFQFSDHQPVILHFRLKR